jgi:hypothetical protein
VRTNETITVFLQANCQTTFRIEINSFCIGDDKCCLSLCGHILLFSSLSLLTPKETGSEIHQVSYSMGTGGSSPGIERPGREADHSLPPTTEVKKAGAIPPLPILLHYVVFNYAHGQLYKLMIRYRFTASSAGFQTSVRKHLQVSALNEYSSSHLSISYSPECVQ